MSESRIKRRLEEKEFREESNLDFILNILSLTPRSSGSNTPVKGDHNHMFDYNFSLLQTVILILLIGMLALGGLVLAFGLLT